MRSRALLAIVGTAAAAALVTAGCTSDGSHHADRPGASGTPAREVTQPRPFAAADDSTPAGATVAQCSDLRTRHNTGLAVRFAVPAGFTSASRGGGGCGFSGHGFAREMSVSFGPMESLEHMKEHDVDPFEDVGGDDSVSDISYADDVPVFGRHRGERLDYYCYCDGQDLDEHIAQARGVRVHWTTPHGKDPRADDFDAVRASLALIRSRRSTCTWHGRTATYRPPLPQTESIDNYQGRCHIYLQPGRNSLQRYAEIAPAPRHGTEQLATSLRHRPRVSRVRLERGAATLDGQRADRLTWLWTREKEGEFGEPAGTWRAELVATRDLQVTWSARPRQWRQEADVVRRFVDSVHLLPADR